MAAVPEVPLPLPDDDVPGLPGANMLRNLAIQAGVRESHIREAWLWPFFMSFAKAFTQIDFDGNGFIGVGELRYLLTVLGEVAVLQTPESVSGGEG